MWLFAFQGGVRVSRSVQLGLPAYSRARILVGAENCDAPMFVNSRVG